MIVPMMAYHEPAGIVPAAVCEVESIRQVSEFGAPLLVTAKVWKAVFGVTGIV